MSEPFLCRDLSDPTAVRYVLGRCRDFFSMTSVERTVYLSVGTFDLVIAIFNLIVLITVRALREPPSDILLILTVFAIVKTLLIFITISTASLNQFTMTSSRLTPTPPTSIASAGLPASSRLPHAVPKLSTR